MYSDTEVKEQKEVIYKRVPPGDRWTRADGSNASLVYPSLTDALEAWYQDAGDTQFYIDARRGVIEIIFEEKVAKEIKKFSIYGEE